VQQTETKNKLHVGTKLHRNNSCSHCKYRYHIGQIRHQKITAQNNENWL